MGSGFSKNRPKSKGKAGYSICSGAGDAAEKPPSKKCVPAEKEKDGKSEANAVIPTKDDLVAEKVLSGNNKAELDTQPHMPTGPPKADIVTQQNLTDGVTKEDSAGNQSLSDDTTTGNLVVRQGKEENGCAETDSLEKLIESAIADELDDSKAGSQPSFVTPKDSLSSNLTDRDSTAANKPTDIKNDPIEVVLRANGDAGLGERTTCTSMECNTSRSASDSGVVSEDNFKSNVQKSSDGDFLPLDEYKTTETGHSSNQGLRTNTKFFSYENLGSSEIRDKPKATTGFDGCREINLISPEKFYQRETAKSEKGIDVTDANLVSMGKKFSREEIEAKLREPNFLDQTSARAEFDVSVYDNISANSTGGRIHDTSVKKKLDDFMEAELRFAERRSNNKDRATYLREMRDKIRQKTETKVRKNRNDDF